MSSPLPPAGPTDGTPVTGRVLGSRGFWVPRRRPETVTLAHLRRS
jgi:alpha-galactosidase